MTDIKPLNPMPVKPMPLQIKQLDEQEQKEYMKRVKSGETPFVLSNAAIRMSSFISCVNHGDEIILNTKLEKVCVFRGQHKQVSRMFDDISKLLEAIEAEDYESMHILQKYIKKNNMYN